MINNLPVILAIDTSCDETAVAVTCGYHILSNIVASQAQLHKEYGGVFPTLAKQQHLAKLPATTTTALKRAKLTWHDIDAIAVTKGPGLAPALETGINFAKQLAQENELPLIPINHIEGHLLSVLCQPKPKDNLPNAPVSPVLPALGVIVSGKHTEFIQVLDLGKYKILGSTIDDAAGEALDKIGRLLGLGYPAGPVLEGMAKEGDAQKYQLPLPMTTSPNYDMSYSGLKTAVRNLVTKLEEKSSLTATDIRHLAASSQYAIFRHLSYKLDKLLANYQFSSIWIGGGVAANLALRQEIRRVANKHGIDSVLTPYSKKLCGDNAAMIGVAAYHRWQEQLFTPSSTQLDREPRWAIDKIQ